MIHTHIYIYTYIHTIEYYLVTKEGNLPFVTTCMDFECIMLSKINQ